MMVMKMSSNEWKKRNMKGISIMSKTEFVEKFRDACKELGIKQSDVFRKAMQEIIDEAEKKSS